jgi:hypothetical protein
VRIAGVGGVLFLAIIFALVRRHADIDYWLPLALWIFLPLIILFVFDIFLRHWLIVQCGGASPVFGGIWLTLRARLILQGAPEAYANQDLAEGQWCSRQPWS